MPLQFQQSGFVFSSCPLLIKGHLHHPRNIASGFALANAKVVVCLVLDIRLEVAVCHIKGLGYRCWTTEVLQIVLLIGFLITLPLCSVSFTCENVTLASDMVTGLPTIRSPLQTHPKATSLSLHTASQTSLDPAPSGWAGPESTAALTLLTCTWLSSQIHPLRLHLAIKWVN